MLEIETKYWSKGLKLVAGVDEAGRGPLAGPVVAACVIFNPNDQLEGIKDSKKLSDKKRKVFYDIIFENAVSVGIGIVHEDIIDKINILQATFLAMNKSIGSLQVNPEQILVDGPYSNIKLYPVENIVKGDNLSQSIAAASIVAKVTRDNLMINYDRIYPEYGFAQHKGYGTKYHIEKIKEIKSSPIHRKSFRIVSRNLPDFKYFEELDNGFSILGHQIIGGRYIKKGYIVVDDKISCNNKGIIDYCFISKKKSTFIFLKIISIYNNIINTIDTNPLLENEKYNEVIKEYMKKNNYTKKYTFNVISIEFNKSKKPIIKIFDNA